MSLCLYVSLFSNDAETIQCEDRSGFYFHPMAQRTPSLAEITMSESAVTQEPSPGWNIEAGCVGGVRVLGAQAGTLRLAPGCKEPFSWHSGQM